MKYKAKPIVVDAFKIVSVGSLTENGNVNIATDDGVDRKADAPMLSRISPVEGDYWVIQEDGYEYLNPKETFERKYEPVE